MLLSRRPLQRLMRWSGLWSSVKLALWWLRLTLRCLCCDTVRGPHRFGGFAPCVPRLAWLKQTLPAEAANAFVFLMASVMERGCIAEPATVLWQGICSAAGSIPAGEAEDSSSRNDDLPDKPELHGSITLTNSEPQACRKAKAKLEPQETQKIQKKL